MFLVLLLQLDKIGHLGIITVGGPAAFVFINFVAVLVFVWDGARHLLEIDEVPVMSLHQSLG